jgi:hypothetical protein
MGTRPLLFFASIQSLGLQLRFYLTQLCLERAPSCSADVSRISDMFLITTSLTCTLRPRNCTLMSSALSPHPPSIVIGFVCHKYQVSTRLRFSEPPFYLGPKNSSTKVCVEEESTRDILRQVGLGATR